MFKSAKDSIHFSSEHKKNSAVKWLIKVNESLPFNIFLGEGGFIYILHGFIKTVLKLFFTTITANIITNLSKHYLIIDVNKKFNMFISKSISQQLTNRKAII